MADYFPLLSRAISALPESTPDTRRAVYDRARNALLGQLRTIQPPMDESAIDAESDSLDDAISRIERELETAPKSDGAETPQAVTPQAVKPEAVKPAMSEAPAVPQLAPAIPEARLPQAEPALPPMRTPLRPLPPMPPLRREAPAGEFSAFSPPESMAESAPVPGTASERFVPAGDGDDDGGAPAVAIRAPGMRHDPSMAARESGRPAAPAAPEAGQSFTRPLLWVSLALVAVVGLGILGWTLRVPPEDFARPRSAQTLPSDRDVSKTGQRAGGEQDGAGASQDAASAKPSLAQGSGNASGNASSSGSSSPAGSAPGNRAEAQRPVQQAETTSAAAAQRAALLVQAAVNDQQNITTHIGSTIWRLVPSERSGARGQPAIRGDVDLPEIALRLTLTIEKNTDTTLRASHTMTMRFTPGADSKFPAVAELGAPQMRNESAPAVDPLAGVQAKITENIFIIALTGEPAFAARNIETMKTRGWFDFPLRMADGRIAKITLEKGVIGDRMFEEAFEAWK